MTVARGFAINPRCRFLHGSYSRELVNQNSSSIIDIMSTVEYRVMWGRTLRADSSAKGLSDRRWRARFRHGRHLLGDALRRALSHWLGIK